MTAAAAVLVTGASGFVGRAVVSRLLRDGIEVRAAVRGETATAPAGARAFGGLDLGGEADWSAALDGVATIIHCAARVHVMRDAAPDPLAEFRRVNVEGTLTLASQAAAAGVKRLVFVSSIGVNGAQTYARPFHADDAPAPHSPYARSKLEAENALAGLSARTGLERVIVRPPLIYGPDAPGNFRTLMRVVSSGAPLPLGAVDNRRSFVAIDNLVDLLVRCANHPAAAGQTFLVSDGKDVSTTELLQRLGRALGRPARLLPVPPGLLRATLGLLGKGDIGQRLCGSLQVDIGPTRELLGWQPPISLDEGLRRAAAAFLGDQAR